MKSFAALSALIGATACAYIAFHGVDLDFPALYGAAAFCCGLCLNTAWRIHCGNTEEL